MELNLLEDTEIKNIDLNGNNLSFSVDVMDTDIDVVVTGLKTLTLEDEDVSLSKLLDITNLENVDVEVVEFDEDSFSKVTFSTELGDFVLEGDMIGKITNLEVAEELLRKMSEDE